MQSRRVSFTYGDLTSTPIVPSQLSTQTAYGTTPEVIRQFRNKNLSKKKEGTNHFDTVPTNRVKVSFRTT